MFPLALFILEELKQDKRKRMRIKRRLRDLQNPFHMKESNFKLKFRLPKHLALELLDKIKVFKDANQPDSLPIMLQFLYTLNYLIHGSYKIKRGRHAIVCAKDPKIARSIYKITLLITRVQEQYVKFPETEKEIQDTILRFKEKTNFPGILGIIDATHVGFTNKTKRNGFYNRNKFFSLNIQLVCNYDLEIIDVSHSYWGGLTTDDWIFLLGDMYGRAAQLYNTSKSVWLLGDNGLCMHPFLLTPYKIPNTPDEIIFNKKHHQAFSRFDKCVGLLKNRFRCLEGEQKIPFSFRVCHTIIRSCIVLHNILIQNRIPVDDYQDYRYEKVPVAAVRGCKKENMLTEQQRQLIIPQLKK